MSFTTTRLVGVTLVALALLLAGCDTFTGSDQIAELETQNAQLQGTIQVVGTPVLTIAALEQAATQNVVFQAQLTESAVNLLEAQSTLTVYELGGADAAAAAAAGSGATPVPAAPPGDQPAAVPTPPPSATRSATTFSGTVIATSLDSADCPVNTTSRVEYTAQRIYVDTRINLLPAGSQISARWYVNGELFFDDVECWIPNRDWQDICAYCSIQPDGPTFPVGMWSVEMYLNGDLMTETTFETYDPAAETGGSLSDAAGGAATE